MANEAISQLNGAVELDVIASADQIPVTDKSDTSESGNGTTKPCSRKTLIKLATATKTTDYTTTDEDDFLFLNAATSKTLTLIAGGSRGVGRPYYIKNINSGVWIIEPNGSEQIDGADTLDVDERTRVIITWTGTAWETF